MNLSIDEAVRLVVQSKWRAAKAVRMEPSDLHQCASLGALEAAQRFDATRMRVEDANAWLYLQATFAVCKQLTATAKYNSRNAYVSAAWDAAESRDDGYDAHPDASVAVAALKASLPPADWDLLCQRYVFGVDVAELADELRTTRNAIKQRLFAARRQARSLIDTGARAPRSTTAIPRTP